MGGVPGYKSRLYGISSVYGAPLCVRNPLRWAPFLRWRFNPLPSLLHAEVMRKRRIRMFAFLVRIGDGRACATGLPAMLSVLLGRRLLFFLQGADVFSNRKT